MSNNRFIHIISTDPHAITRKWLQAGLAAFAAAALQLSSPAHGAGLECPASTGVVSEANFKGLMSAKVADVANEINEIVYRMQVERPNISYNEMTDSLLGAYCNALVRVANVPANEQWKLMRRFERIMESQLSANTMPSGTEILATVPLPPAVFNALRSQAAGAGQTTAQLMTAILSAATGR